MKPAPTTVAAAQATENEIQIAGVIAGLKVAKSKRSGEMYAQASLEDAVGKIDLICFPKDYERLAEKLKIDVPVLVRGVLRGEEDAAPKLAVSSVQALEDVKVRLPQNVRIRVPLERASEATLFELQKIIAAAPGTGKFMLNLEQAGEYCVVLEPAGTAIAADRAFIERWTCCWDAGWCRHWTKCRTQSSGLRAQQEVPGFVPQGSIPTREVCPTSCIPIQSNERPDSSMLPAESRLICVMTDQAPAAPQSNPAATETKPLAWIKTELARHPQRPDPMSFIESIFTDFSEIHGDRPLATMRRCCAAWRAFDGEQVMVIGNLKGRSTKEKVLRNFGMPDPEGYRKALRAMQLAEKFGRPIFTFLDLTAQTRASEPKSAARPKRSPATCGRCRACACPPSLPSLAKGDRAERSPSRSPTAS